MMSHVSHISMYTKLKPAGTELGVKPHQEAGQGTCAHGRAAALAHDQLNRRTPFRKQSSEALIQAGARHRNDPDSLAEELQSTLPVSNSM